MERIMLMVAMVAALAIMLAAPALAQAFRGTDGSDTIVGTERHDLILGRGGHDTLSGRGGTDDINGGSGRDVIRGGDGEDLLRGAAGRDTIYAGDDKDSDEIRCGSGFDIAYVAGNDHSRNNITGCEDVRSQ